MSEAFSHSTMEGKPKSEGVGAPGFSAKDMRRAQRDNPAQRGDFFGFAGWAHDKPAPVSRAGGVLD